MTARYKVLQVTKGAHIHECQDCGALVHHRSIHETWHALWELADLIRLLEERTDSDAERP